MCAVGVGRCTCDMFVTSCSRKSKADLLERYIGSVYAETTGKTPHTALVYQTAYSAGIPHARSPRNKVWKACLQDTVPSHRVSVSMLQVRGALALTSLPLFL